MLSVAGFKVFDLGVDEPVPTLVEKARIEGADIIGVSALLTTTMMKQRDVVEALDDMGLRSDIKVIFASPEFNIKSAEVIAEEIGGEVILISPLAENYTANLENIAGALEKSMQ